MSEAEQTQELLDQSVRALIEATAAKTPTPGGGSVAGVVGALGTALGEMALTFTRGKKKYAEHAETHARLAGRLAKARQMFQDLVYDDMQAFAMYQAATRLDDGPDKEQAVQLATAAAIDVPRETAKLALAVLGDLEELSGCVNPWLVTDLLASAALAEATVRLCDYNVRINVPNVADAAQADDVRRSSSADLLRAEQLRADIESACQAYLP